MCQLQGRQVVLEWPGIGPGSDRRQVGSSTLAFMQSSAILQKAGRVVA